MVGEQKMNEHFIHTEKGYCYYDYDYDGDKPIIYDLYIEKNYRGQGNARHLLELVIAEIRRKGFSKEIFVQAEPRENSIDKETLTKFYESMGLTVRKVSRNEQL